MNKLQQTLLTTITSQPTDWSAIVSEVGKKHTIKNWMVVRNQLQQLLNSGLVTKVDSIEVEQYQKNWIGR